MPATLVRSLSKKSLYFSPPRILSRKITELELQTTARERFPVLRTLSVFTAQSLHELYLRIVKKIPFRAAQNEEASAAYEKMDAQDLERINLRQAWANWRVIPRALSRRIPDRPLDALDLCCGTGQSTEVLAYYLPAGSHILGLELNPRFVEHAQSKRYFHRSSFECSASFRAQSVLETFRGTNGVPLPDASLDLVLCVGSISAHFKSADCETLTQEIRRVLRPQGWAMLDAGKPGTTAPELRAILERAGFQHCGSEKCCKLDPCSQEVFQKI